MPPEMEKATVADVFTDFVTSILLYFSVASETALDP